MLIKCSFLLDKQCHCSRMEYVCIICPYKTQIATSLFLFLLFSCIWFFEIAWQVSAIFLIAFQKWFAIARSLGLIEGEWSKIIHLLCVQGGTGTHGLLVSSGTKLPLSRSNNSHLKRQYLKLTELQLTESHQNTVYWHFRMWKRCINSHQ